LQYCDQKKKTETNQQNKEKQVKIDQHCTIFTRKAAKVDGEFQTFILSFPRLFGSNLFLCIPKIFTEKH
jgi:hypothetical protein